MIKTKLNGVSFHIEITYKGISGNSAKKASTKKVTLFGKFFL